jgi:phosphatidate cytidylyltransferase
MLKQRTLTTLIALPVLLAAVWFDSPLHWFTILMVVWGAVAAFEFYTLASVASLKPLLYFGTAWTVLLIVVRDVSVASFLQVSPDQISLMLMVAATVLPLVWLLRREPKSQAFSTWVWTLGGMAYVGLLSGHFVALRTLAGGRNWVYLAFLATFASDTSAYFVGRTWGKRKLAPSISPAKTWEGSLGGLAGGALISLLFVPSTLFSATNPLHIPDLNYWWAPLLGIVVSAFGQLGDLVESLLKRNMGAKDSGKLFPGHGGALDRIDSVVFAGVVVYYFVWLIR